MASTTPGALTKRRLEDMGYDVDRVEQNHRVGRVRWKTDLYHCIDYLAIKPGVILGVQATSHQHVGERVTKAVHGALLKSKNGERKIPGKARAWLRAGGELEVWGWRKDNGRWNVRRVRLYLSSDEQRVKSIDIGSGDNGRVV